MRLFELGELLSRSWPRPRAESRLGTESGQPPVIEPASAHRLSPGPARLRRRGHDRRGSERRKGTERRGNLVLPPSTWIRRLGRLGSFVRGVGSEPTFWLAGLLLIAASISWVFPAMKVGGWGAPFISATIILASSIVVLHYQRYLKTKAEQRAEDLETKYAHLGKLYRALQTKLGDVQSKLDSTIADRESLSELLETKLRESTEPSQGA